VDPVQRMEAVVLRDHELFVQRDVTDAERSVDGESALLTVGIEVLVGDALTGSIAGMAGQHDDVVRE
jgi:hypothetical protein